WVRASQGVDQKNAYRFIHSVTHGENAILTLQVHRVLERNKTVLEVPSDWPRRWRCPRSRRLARESARLLQSSPAASADYRFWRHNCLPNLRRGLGRAASRPTAGSATSSAPTGARGARPVRAGLH